eukprot:15445945-Alexandrium_andersonii.AAC.1
MPNPAMRRAGGRAGSAPQGRPGGPSSPGKTNDYSHRVLPSIREIARGGVREDPLGHWRAGS